MLLIKPFSRDSLSIASILAFCRAHPARPTWPESLIARFLQELSSDPANVVDLHKSGERVAVAVLVDQIANLGNLACLEVVGISSLLSTQEIYSALVSTCALRIPRHKDGFQISVHDQIPLSESFFTQYGLQPYYDSYDMICPTRTRTQSAPAGLFESVESDLPELYGVARETALHSPDIAIPDFERWKGNIHSPKQNARTWIKKVAGAIVGYVRLAELDSNEGPEIRIVGVLPAHRSQGIGKELLSHALDFAAQNGSTQCRLSVAVTNEAALNLYLGLGFKMSERFRVYRTPVDQSAAT